MKANLDDYTVKDLLHALNERLDTDEHVQIQTGTATITVSKSTCDCVYIAGEIYYRWRPCSTQPEPSAAVRGKKPKKPKKR